MIKLEYFWLNVFMLALGTIAIRGSIIAISARVRITDRTKEIFSYIPAAILPAIVAPMVFFHNGQVDWLLEKERFVVLAVATGVCYLTRSMFATIAFGLIALYLASHMT